MVFDSEPRDSDKEVQDVFFSTSRKRCVYLLSEYSPSVIKAAKARHEGWQVKAISAADLLSEAGKLLDYTSARHKKPLYELLGLRRLLLLTYHLDHLDRSKKTLFGYALKGRDGKGGLLKELKGQVIGRNSILFPAEKEIAAKEFIDFWKAKHETREVFCP